MWLSGDFHAHTARSDGDLTPASLLEAAERLGLDFFAITDHNTWTYPELGDAAVTVIAGVEVTMDYGHFNAFVADGVAPGWLDLVPSAWEPHSYNDQPGRSRELLDAIAAAGDPVSINHPLIHPYAWLDGATPLGVIRYVEVWNDPTWPENRYANPAALAMWTRWLNAGIRIPAVGGSDFHRPDGYQREDGFSVAGNQIGLPRTWVDAPTSSSADLLTAVDAGRAYVSLGPTIRVAARCGGIDLTIGDRAASKAQPIEVVAEVMGEGALTAKVVINGATVALGRGEGGTEVSWRSDASLTGWLRIDVADEAGDVLAFTNPVYLGSDTALPEAPVFADYVDETAVAIHERATAALRAERSGTS